MSTTTFKGARYITAFADPIQWDDTRAYEAITAVQHNAFTYISKQPVPVGVQIDNEEFWLLWADPNAQMEQLRRIVEQYADNVEELSGVVGDLNTELATEIQNRETADNAETQAREAAINAEQTARENADIEINEKIHNSQSNVMTYGAKEKDDTVNWNDIITQIASVSDTVYFPAGEWYINETLTFPNNILNVIGSFAHIIATETMDYMFEVNAENTIKMSKVDNIYLDCNDNANSCLHVTSLGTQTNIVNCKFLDFKTYGVKCESIGSVLNNCHFSSNRDANTDSIGFSGLTDNVLNGCRFFCCSTAVKCNAVVSTGCYIWGGRINKKTIAFASQNDSSICNISCIGNELDGCCTFFFNCIGNVIGNRILVNLSDSIYSNTIICLFESAVNYTNDYYGMAFNDNEIRYIGPSDFNRAIHTFVQNSNNVNFCFNSFTSENNQHFIFNDTVNAKYVSYGYGLHPRTFKTLPINQYLLKICLINGKTTFNGSLEYALNNTTRLYFRDNATQALRGFTWNDSASVRALLIGETITETDMQAIYMTCFNEYRAHKISWMLGTYVELTPITSTEERDNLLGNRVNATNNFVCVAAS